MQNKIYAISGLKNSGKDTAAEMLQYLLNTPKIFHHYWWYKHIPYLGKINKKYKIRSFAYPLKKMLSVLLNVPINKFNDREFKEKTCVKFPNITVKETSKIWFSNTLTDNKFNKLAKNLDTNFCQNNWLTIRQLMQFFGTNVMRTYFGDGLWTYMTLKDSNLIISDLRFKIEMDIIKTYNSKIIYINRDSCKPGAHASEQEVIEMYNDNIYDCVINNNGTLKELFNNIKLTIN